MLLAVHAITELTMLAFTQVRLVWVDNPESVHKQIKEYFGEHLGSGVYLRGGDPDDGIKLDIGHVQAGPHPANWPPHVL